MSKVWEKYGSKTKPIMDFNEGYKKFLSESKTEREATINAVALAKKAGFKDLKTCKTLKAGDKVYVVNRGKNVCLFVIGQKDLEEGMNILGAHIDSPRLDLKQHPLYEDNNLVLLDTHYYGGIKKYLWVAQPMALHGVVCLTNGQTVDICIGEKDDDPVVGISDLLIHLSRDLMQKTAAKVVEGEDMNVLIGSMPKKGKKDEKELVKAQILDLLKKEYGIEEDDFVSAEIEVVPAGKARDFGLDRSMVMGYGHDDRICAYTSLMASLEMDKPERTSCCILVDKEEVGSQGSTGMQSKFFENTILEMLDKVGKGNILALNHAIENSRMLSSDVSCAYDPNYPGATEPKNTAYFGNGIVFNKYTGSGGKSGCNDANAEFIAKLRKVLDDEKVIYQTSELGRVDQGGGGTIAYILANLNMDVIDAGIALQNMHACYEVASKADVYEAYQAYKAFLKGMK